MKSQTTERRLFKAALAVGGHLPQDLTRGGGDAAEVVRPHVEQIVDAVGVEPGADHLDELKDLVVGDDAVLYVMLVVGIEELVDVVKNGEADGVVYSMVSFCDPEEYDYPLLSKRLLDEGIPGLYVEFNGREGAEQNSTRIQAFAEMLEKR